MIKTYKRIPVLVWCDDEIHVEHRASHVSQDTYNWLTSYFGSPKGVIKDYSELVIE